MLTGMPMPAFAAPASILTGRTSVKKSRPRCHVLCTARYPVPHQLGRRDDRRLILGLTKYTHDAAVAVVDADTGEVLFALAKERLTRRKHDGGGVAALVRHALRHATCADCGFDPDGIFDADAAAAKVFLIVTNNHHFRIAPYERALPFSIAAGYAPPEYASPWNLLAGTGGCHSRELSHHLAHAYSAIFNSPETTGLVVIMDGMGDLRDDWLRAESPSYHNSTSPACASPGSAGTVYHNDLQLPVDDSIFREYFGDAEYPTPGVSFREAESAFRFVKRGAHVELTRLYKRWTPEASPPELRNHGFHDMESVGAVYSRCATQVFGDWNACGKVMGLAPWVSVRDNDGAASTEPLMSGRLFSGSFRVNSDALEQIPQLGQFDNADEDTSFRRLQYEELAARIQSDLEHVVLAFLSDLKRESGETNLVFAGGVALNSTLNGRIIRESGFDHVFVPAHPGDEGVALGCAMFGYAQQARDQTTSALPSPPPFSPYLGTGFTLLKLRAELSRYASWVTFEEMPGQDATVRAVVEALCEGEVVGWCCGRSEFGPRALGNRSLLADPRRADMVETLNRVVKKRELFRPFAPSCIEEHVGAAFGADCPVDASRYMSMTHQLLHPNRTPAVAHVDGSARLQTLSQADNPIYHALIRAFQDKTGTGMLLNTSFNVAGEPIVDSCEDALRTLLDAEGIGLLAFPDQNILVRRRESSPGTRDDNRLVSLNFSAGSMRSKVERNGAGDTLRVSIDFDIGGEEVHGNEDGAHVYEELKTRRKPSPLATDDIYLEEIETRRTVELRSEEELELIELIVGEDEPRGITLHHLLDVTRCEDDEVNSGDNDEVAGGDGVESDVVESVRDMVEQLWRQRVLRIDLL
jgi:carbamoyltransferase